MKKFFDEFFIRLFSWIINHSWVVIALLLIVTISAGLQLPKMKIVTDLKSLLPRDEIYKNDERIRDAFNIKDLVIIGVKNKKSVFNTDTFEYIKALIDKIELLNGVYKVRSLFSEDNISNTPEESLNRSKTLKQSRVSWFQRISHSLPFWSSLKMTQQKAGYILR